MWRVLCAAKSHRQVCFAKFRRPPGWKNLKEIGFLSYIILSLLSVLSYKMAEMAKAGEIDVTIRPVTKADILLIAQSFNIKKTDGSLFKPADTLTSFMERFNELIRNGDGFFGTIRQLFLNDTEELALPTGRMSFAFPSVITEGTVKCYIVNKQRNGMERFLAAPAPLAVEDDNFVIADNGNEPVAAPPPAPTPVAAPPGDFLALMGAMLDKQSAGIRNEMKVQSDAQATNIDVKMNALSAGL
ncbi:MAG: hypothetical protein GY927_21855, partial [bacterium]|nr:hypothetical protein [bacterium]